jgi:hypothetical protein
MCCGYVGGCYQAFDVHVSSALLVAFRWGFMGFAIRTTRLAYPEKARGKLGFYIPSTGWTDNTAFLQTNHLDFGLMVMRVRVRERDAGISEVCVKRATGPKARARLF